MVEQQIDMFFLLLPLASSGRFPTLFNPLKVRRNVHQVRKKTSRWEVSPRDRRLLWREGKTSRNLPKNYNAADAVWSKNLLRYTCPHKVTWKIWSGYWKIKVYQVWYHLVPLNTMNHLTNLDQNWYISFLPPQEHFLLMTITSTMHWGRLLLHTTTAAV